MSAAGSINTHIQKADVCSIACSVANVPQHADYRKLVQFRLCAHYVWAPRLKYTPGAFLSIYAKHIHGASLTQWRLLSANLHLFFLLYQTGSRLHFSIQRAKYFLLQLVSKGNICLYSSVRYFWHTPPTECSSAVCTQPYVHTPITVHFYTSFLHVNTHQV